MNDKKAHCGSGFTLVEMLVTVSIAGIILASAFPSFQAILQNNKIISYTNDFKMALYYAQNESVKRNIRVAIVTKTTGNDLWEDGWDIFEDRNENGSYDSASEELIYTYTPNATNYTLKSKTPAYNTDISFNSLGEPVTSGGVSSNGEFRICGPDNDTSKSRTIKTNFSGNIIVSEGTSTCP